MSRPAGMYQTPCKSGSSRWLSGRNGARLRAARRPRIVWSLLISVIWPSRTLMWLGTWTNGASALVTTSRASLSERPSASPSGRRDQPCAADRAPGWLPSTGQPLCRPSRSPRVRCALVIYRSAGPARGHHELAGDGPGLVRRQEDREVGDLRRVHHAVDGVAARRVVRVVASLDFLGRDAQLLGAGGQQARGALRARDAGMDAVHRDPEAAQLDGQRLGEVHERGVARPTAEIAGVARVGAADVDDATPALLLHVGNYGAW